MSAAQAMLNPWLDEATEAGAITLLEAWRLHWDALTRPGQPVPPALQSPAYRLNLHHWDVSEQPMH